MFSFAEISSYRKVGRILSDAKVNYREWTEDEMVDFSRKLADMNLDLELATCAEKVDLSEFGIRHNRCIDPELICRLSPELEPFIHNLKTDKGQRTLCGCITSKDIGTYNTCPHGCAYCYANTSVASARQNFLRHQRNPNNDSIL